MKKNKTMTRKEAQKWAKDKCANGTWPARQAYIEQNRVGEIAQHMWNDDRFTYGIEYGILIAVAMIYGDLQEKSRESMGYDE